MYTSVISNVRTMECPSRAEHPIFCESRVDSGSIFPLPRLNRECWFHPHLIGLYRFAQTLAQLGITEQLDSGIYLLYQRSSQNISTLCHIVKVPLMQPKQNVLTLFTQNCVTSFDSSSTLLATVKLSPFPLAASLWFYEGCGGLLM